MFHTHLIKVCMVVAVMTVPPRARADPGSGWTLTTGDLRTRPVGQVSIDAAGIHPTGSPMVQWNQFVSLRRDQAYSAIASRFVLLLDTGQRLVGTPLGMTADALLWQEPTLGKVAAPLYRLRGLVLGNARLIEPLGLSKQDVVTLANGDSVSGVLTACSADTVTVQTDTGNIDVSLGAVAKISFAVTAAPSTRPITDPELRVRLDDGSIFSAEHLSVAGMTCSLHWPGRMEEASLPLAQIESFEAVDGPVLWLADTPSAHQTLTPYFGPLPGESVGMNSATADPEMGDHNLTVHARSRLRFDIPAGCSSFQTQFGIAGLGPLQRHARPWADVTVRVYLDDRLAFEQPHVHSGSPSPVISLQLGRAKQLTLECDFGDGGGVQAQLTWINPLLLRPRP